MATAYPINPTLLLGLTFDFVEYCVIDGQRLPYPFTGRVLAVQVPLPGSGIEWSLLIEQPAPGGRIVCEYSDLNDLEFEWPDAVIYGGLNS